MKIFGVLAQLQPYVQSIWSVNHTVSDLAIRKIVPDGSCEILINRGQPFQLSHDGIEYKLYDSAILFFIRDRINYLIQGGVSKAIGIRIKPYGLHMLIGMEMANFKIKVIPLYDVLPELNTKFVNLPDSDPEAVDVIQNILLCAFSKPFSRKDKIAAALYDEIEIKNGLVSLKQLLRQFKLNYKFCERLFLRYFGITPKKYIRYRRLSFALNEINKATERLNFIAIVTRYGFHDQAHLIREFIELTGVSPLSIYAFNNTLQKFYQDVKDV